MTGPCPTCRHEVEHLIALDPAITDLRDKSRTHRSVHGVLAHFIDIAGQVTRRHRKHRHDEHRDAIRDLAEHLPSHTQRRDVA